MTQNLKDVVPTKLTCPLLKAMLAISFFLEEIAELCDCLHFLHLIPLLLPKGKKFPFNPFNKYSNVQSNELC